MAISLAKPCTLVHGRRQPLTKIDMPFMYKKTS